jgi:hypothetical protein
METECASCEVRTVLYCLLAIMKCSDAWRPTVLENLLLRRIFVPKRNEVSVWKTGITAVRTRRTDHETLLYSQKLALISPTCGGHSVGIGRSRITSEELHNLYSSLSVIKLIKWRIMRWAGRIAHMGKKRNGYMGLVGKPEREKWGKAVAVLNWLSTTPRRHMGEWMYRSTFSWPLY